MNFIPEYMLEGIAADKTAVMASGETYIGDFDREKYNPEGAPIEEQPIWKIKKICVTEEGGNVLYEAKYPDGNANLYRYKWSDIQSLNYQFANNK